MIRAHIVSQLVGVGGGGMVSKHLFEMVDDSTLVQISTFSFLSQVVHRLYFGCLLVGYA